MKKTLLLLSTVIMITGSVHAQTTFYGSLAGQQGNNSSYFGFLAGSLSNGSTTDNTYIGALSGGYTTSGTQNVAVGSKSLLNNSSGGANVANGFESLYNSTSGSFNTASGFLTLHENTTGSGNTATGSYALYSNIDGAGNTASGNFSLYLNRNGINNASVGTRSLYNNASGSHNAAVGFEALFNNATGSSNAALGVMAAYNTSRGRWNTAVGSNSLYNNTIGEFNSALGFNAGPNSGAYYNTTCLGYNASATAPNQVRIGNSNVTSIGGQVGWTTLSDGRFKRNIREDVSGLEFINKLRPVSYEIDRKAVNAFLRVSEPLENPDNAKKRVERQTGFVAQEVEALVKKSGYVFHGVEAPQNEGDHYSIRYAEFVVPLVKAVQELTAKLNEQEKKVEAQELVIATLKQKLGAYEGVSENNGVVKVGLFQNNPNPFSTDTEIRMSLPETTVNASLILYNMEGKQLKSITVNERGNAAVKISGNDLYAGVYLYALVVDGKVVDTKRLVLTK